MPKQLSGHIDLDVRDSTPDWSAFLPDRAPQGSPNVLVVLYDDTGCAAWSPYGGRIDIPTMQRLADNGLTYSQWHTTALCSPTRSTFLTGRNHHLNGFATISESSTGFPGYSSHIPPQDATMATPQRLGQRGQGLRRVPDDLQQNLSMIDQLGTPDTYNHYPTGWAVAFSTPYRMFKRYTYQGGVCDPLVIHWPAGIRARGEVRHQYHHSPDILPTILDVCGVEMPEVVDAATQTPLSGVSMRYSFDDAGAPRPSRPSTTRCSAPGGSGIRAGRP